MQYKTAVEDSFPSIVGASGKELTIIFDSIYPVLEQFYALFGPSESAERKVSCLAYGVTVLQFNKQGSHSRGKHFFHSHGTVREIWNQKSRTRYQSAFMMSISLEFSTREFLLWKILAHYNKGQNINEYAIASKTCRSTCVTFSLQTECRDLSLFSRSPLDQVVLLSKLSTVTAMLESCMKPKGSEHFKGHGKWIGHG